MSEKAERDWKGGTGMSQKRKEPLGACEGKVAFASYGDATRVEGRHGTDSRKKRHAYHCSVCHQWHLGRLAGKNTATIAKLAKRARLMELRGEDD